MLMFQRGVNEFIVFRITSIASNERETVCVCTDVLMLFFDEIKPFIE
jgi:hypothetical protein